MQYNKLHLLALSKLLNNRFIHRDPQRFERLEKIETDYLIFWIVLAMYLTCKKLEKQSLLLIFLDKVIQTSLQKLELLFLKSEIKNSQMCNNHTL